MANVETADREEQRLSDVIANRLTLRLAFAAAFGFSLAILFDWEFSFLTPMLAIQILAAMPSAPGFRQGVAIPLLIFFAGAAALVMSSIFSGTPVVLLATTGLVICWTFYAQRRGASAIAMFLIQICFCCAPVMSTISLDLAGGFTDALFAGSVGAIVTVWIAHILFPNPAAGVAPPPARKPAGLEPPQAARVAISDTLVLLPLLVAFIIGGNVNNIVILITSLTLLRQIEPSHSGRVAVAILLGNILGGILGVLAYQFVLLADDFVVFILMILGMGLWFGSLIANGGSKAPLYAIAFGTFLLILGLGLTPLPGGSEELFATRIFKIALASVYVLGALSLVYRLRRSQAVGRGA